MSTLSYDFTTGSVEAPLSFGGVFEGLFDAGTPATQLPQLKDNGGQVNAAPNNSSAPCAVSLTAATATFGQKQYAEITVGANWTANNTISGGIFLTAGNNGYFLDLTQPYASSSSNRIAKVVAGVKSTLSPTLSGITLVLGDKLGILGDEVGGTVTLTLYRNPTGYDVDGFPSDGVVASTTDTALTTGTAGLVGYRDNGTDAYATDAYFAGTVGSTPTIDNIDTDNSVQVGQTGVIITTTDIDPASAAQSVALGGEALTINSWAAP